MKRNQTLSMLLMLTATAGLAIAQPAKKNTSDKDLLRGPDVKETNSPRANKENRPEIDVEAELEENPMELREITIAVRMLSSGRVPVEHSLTQDQEDDIKDITMQYREDIRAFQEANVVQIRKLRDEVNKEAKEIRERRKKEAQERKEKGEDAMSDSPKEEKREKPPENKAAKKLREFMNSAPAAKTAIAGIKEVLTEDQFELVEKHVVMSRHRSQAGEARGPRQGRRGMEEGDARPERRERDKDRRVRPDSPEDD